MRTQFLMIIFFFAAQVVSAQGLSGKRMTVFYYLDYSGSTPFPATGTNDYIGYYNFKDDEKKAFFKSRINLRHSLNLNYILSRRIATGLQFGAFRDAYGAGFLEQEEVTPVTHNYKSFSTEAEVKFFKVLKADAIAPLGQYVAFRIGVNKVKTNSKISELFFVDSEEVPTKELDFQAVSLAIAWGKQFILYKKAMMNFGVEFKYYFIKEENITGEFNRGYTSELPTARVIWNDFFRVRIGIGLAPF